MYDNLISFHPRMFRNKYRSCTKSSWLDQNIKSTELQQTTHRPMQCLEKPPNGKNKATLKNNHEKWGKPISNSVLLLSPLFWQRQLHIYFIVVVGKIHEESANFIILELQVLMLGLRTWSIHKEGRVCHETQLRCGFFCQYSVS